MALLVNIICSLNLFLHKFTLGSCLLCGAVLVTNVSDGRKKMVIVN